ncbi:hypothetical protein LPJ53_000202 [Coemansia erecta]|uniref:sn-1-specific diacylglycerol lipase n=1 Tax=Coemansia erecta TaxID=147472 RepID=A0A9W7Y870_9FUNG|nr:hypothetical protein LPJ53_000202 [Coemansia erecta]
MATLVSTFSGATRLSIEITALFWEAIFDTISESTSSGMWLGSAAWHEARTIALAVASVFSPLSSLNPRIISRIISSSTAAGYAMANSSFTAAESFLESGFTLYTSAVNMSLYAAGEYMRFIDALFGSTDTSRVLASFVHMCRREAMEKNPEVGALIKEHGLVGFVSQLIKTIAAWICLQVVTHGRERAYRMELVHTNINADSAFCPRKFIGCDGKPLPGSEKSSAATPLGTSPRIRVSTVTSPVLQNELLSVMPSEEGYVSGIGDIPRHMRAQTNGASASGHEHTNGMYDTDDCMSPADRDGGGCGSSDSSSEVYYALSDQEISHRDPEWDQQLIDALHNLAVQTNRRNDRRNSSNNIDLGEHPDPHSLRRSSKSALWNTLAMVRDASEARVGEPANGNSSSSGDTSSDSDSQQSPLVPSALNGGRVFPAFESAPASLLSSPQFPLTPSLAVSDAAVHRSRTFAESNGASYIDTNSYKRPSVIDLPQPPHGISDAIDAIQPLDDIPPAIESDLSDPFAQSGAKGMQQEFPRKPLLFNIARFVSVASSVYGHNFMKVVGVKHGTIDAKALIDSFSQHTGIPLSDLLFSSYVPPIVPGVANAASVQASAVERKLRRKHTSTASAASTTQSGTEQGKSQTQREPTLNQFRRFDKIRQRLVYRNPSIHALVHYIAVDHSTRSVVLACRGTLGISDLFVDMICEYETVQLPGHPASRVPGQEFRVHSGMWHSALMLANMSSEVFKEVAEALRLYPEYGLVLTGHSPRRFVTTETFGLVSPRPIHCFSFGSPCSTNAALSYYCRGLVTSVANTDDFATYLSVGAFVDIMNISAVLSRERGVTEKIVRRFVLAQREKIGRKLNLFDFDFSKLRAYSYSDDEDDETEQDDRDAGKSWWSWRKSNSTPETSSSSSRPAKRHKSNAKDKSQLKSDLDDWHWSLVKTLRANMDSEKLYPPGDVFVLASPGNDEVADKQLSKLLPEDKGNGNSKDEGKSKSNPAAIPIGLFYCPDVTERFSELRFTRNMLIHHMPSTYERNISALIHETL